MKTQKNFSPVFLCEEFQYEGRSYTYQRATWVLGSEFIDIEDLDITILNDQGSAWEGRTRFSATKPGHYAMRLSKNGVNGMKYWLYTFVVNVKGKVKKLEFDGDTDEGWDAWRKSYASHK